MNMKSVIALVLIICSGAALAQPSAEFGPPDVERRMQEYVRTWEGSKEAFALAINTYYAERVNYYGKFLTRAQVLADKLRFLKAYPQRTYDIASGTLRTNCNGGICQARAELHWSRTSSSGRRESGASDLRLILSARDGGKITRESARTLRTLREN